VRGDRSPAVRSVTMLAEPEVVEKLIQQHSEQAGAPG
jgi:hypothetical protein